MTATRRIQLGGITFSIALTVACATAPARSRHELAPTPSTVPPARRGSDVISADEIARAELGIANAYEALARLRPEIVRRARPAGAGASPAGGPVLYVDGTRQGPVGLLVDIRARAIAEMRYFRPGEALAWFGPGHEEGVIAVRIAKSAR